jgi:hypothetical protein
MKSYHILDCPQQQKIADSLYGYFKGITANKPPSQFWTHLSREQIINYMSIPDLPLLSWFKSLDLRVRDISFTVYDEMLQTSPHVDEPPVVAKINFPVLNTKDTYNVWFDENGNEIDRVECIKPIVLRSNILHTVEIGEKALLPRIQFSFCFYDEPLHLLK